LAAGGDERLEAGAAARGILITGLALDPDHIVPPAGGEEIEPRGSAKGSIFAEPARFDVEFIGQVRLVNKENFY
jgi:hypothetical protein